MQEMERLNYPQHVSDDTQEYYDRWTNRIMHQLIVKNCLNETLNLFPHP